jgi:hypothetical protein
MKLFRHPLLRLPLLVLLLAASAIAQKPGFTVEQVMSSPFPTALTSAAKANRIAWVFDSRGERNVWVADAPEFAARQVTHYQGDDGQDIFAVKLTPDGKTVVFARGSEVSSEGHVANPTTETREPKQQVWAARRGDREDAAAGRYGLRGRRLRGHTAFARRADCRVGRREAPFVDGQLD